MMKDLIDRQEAIKALGERPIVWAGSDYGFGARNQYDKDLLAIETVPSVHPNGPDNLVKDSPGLVKDLVNDCISRKAAIDAIKEDKIDLTNPNVVAVFKATGDFEKVETQVMTCDRHIEILKDLPSAQPEIIRCRDCKHCRRERSEESAKKFGQIYYCARNVFSCPTPDDYCSWAERRSVSE